MAEGQKPKVSVVFKVKESVVKTSLLALATAFEMVSKHAPELKAEVAGWKDGQTFSLGIFPNGPFITLKKVGDAIRYMGKGIIDSDCVIYFKNLDGALMPFTGQMGSHMAFVEHRAFLHGNLGEAMQASRAMCIVQTYLMPGLVFKTIFKWPPKMNVSQLLLKGRVMGLLGVGLVKNMFK